MIVLQWCKTQIMCLLILVYVGGIQIREGNNLKKLPPNQTATLYSMHSFLCRSWQCSLTESLHVR